MQSADPANLFQSSASLQVGIKRSQKASETSSGTRFGSPIWSGKSHTDTERLAQGGAGADGGANKVLDLKLRDEESEDRSRIHQEAWVAESGGFLRRLDLETGETVQVFRGHTAPVSSLDFIEVHPRPSEVENPRHGPKPSGCRTLVVTASWDKSLRFWPVLPRGSIISSSSSSSSSATTTTAPPSPSKQPEPLQVISDAGSDFLKCVHTIVSSNGWTEAILSAGSDKTVRCWDVRPLVGWVESLDDSEWQRLAKEGLQGGGLNPPPQVQVIGTMRDHTRPINRIASLAPHSSFHDPQDPARLPILFTADSMGRVVEMNLEIERFAEGKSIASFKVKRELRGHETGVYDLKAGWKELEVEGEEVPPLGKAGQRGVGDGSEDYQSPCYETDDGSIRRKVAEVWTASSDKTAMLFSLSPWARERFNSTKTLTSTKVVSRISKAGAPLGSQPPLGPVRRIVHPDYVKSILPISHLSSSTLEPNLILTGSSDENIRVWDLDHHHDLSEEKDGNDRSGGAKLIRQVQGHWHEVGNLQAWYRIHSGELGEIDPIRSGEGEWWIVSSSLDGSIRRWRLFDLLKPIVPEDETKGKEEEVGGISKGDQDQGEGVDRSKPKVENQAVTMTEEEERELAELLSEDEE